MTDYPHKDFTGPGQPNKAKERRSKQLNEVWKRRAIILQMMRKMKTK